MCRCTCKQIQVCAGTFVLAHMSTGEYTFWWTHMQVHICEGAHVCVHIYRSFYVSIWLTIPKKNSSWLFSILQMCLLMFPKSLGNYYLSCFIDGGVKVHRGEMTSVRQTRFRYEDSTPVTYAFSTGQHAVYGFHSAAHSVPFPQCSTRCAISTVRHTVWRFHCAAHSVWFAEDNSIPHSKKASSFPSPRCREWDISMPFQVAGHIRTSSTDLPPSAYPSRMVHILFQPRMLSVSRVVAPSQSTAQLKARVYLLYSLAYPWHA